MFGHLKDESFRGRTSPGFEPFRGRAWPDLKSFRADLGAYVALWSTRSRQVKLKGLTPEEFRSQSLVA
nr:IS3 family transposase [uncultured Senegalimassilia sp.]